MRRPTKAVEALIRERLASEPDVIAWLDREAQRAARRGSCRRESCGHHLRMHGWDADWETNVQDAACHWVDESTGRECGCEEYLDA